MKGPYGLGIRARVPLVEVDTKRRGTGEVSGAKARTGDETQTPQIAQVFRAKFDLPASAGANSAT